MKLPQSFTTVTPLSKVLAILLFVSLPFIGFYFGYLYTFNKNYQRGITTNKERSSPVVTITPSKKKIKTDPLIFGNYQISLPENYGWGEMHGGLLLGQVGAGPPVECKLTINGFPYCRYIPIINALTGEETGLILSNEIAYYLNSGISAITDTEETIGTDMYQTTYQIYWNANPDNQNEIALNDNGKPERLVSVEGCPRPELCFICDSYGCDNLDEVKKIINSSCIVEVIPNTFDQSFFVGKSFSNMAMSGEWGTFEGDGRLLLKWGLDYNGPNDDRPNSGIGGWVAENKNNDLQLSFQRTTISDGVYTGFKFFKYKQKIFAIPVEYRGLVIGPTVDSINEFYDNTIKACW